MRQYAIAGAVTLIWVTCVASIASLGLAVWASNLSRGDAVWIWVYLLIICFAALAFLMRCAFALDDYLDERAARKARRHEW